MTCLNQSWESAKFQSWKSGLKLYFPFRSNALEHKASITKDESLFKYLQTVMCLTCLWTVQYYIEITMNVYWCGCFNNFYFYFQVQKWTLDEFLNLSLQEVWTAADMTATTLPWEQPLLLIHMIANTPGSHQFEWQFTLTWCVWKRAGHFQTTLSSISFYHGLDSTNQIRSRRTSRQIESLPKPVEGRAKTSTTSRKAVLCSSLNEINCHDVTDAPAATPTSRGADVFVFKPTVTNSDHAFLWIQLPRRAKFTAAIRHIFPRMLFIIFLNSFKLWPLFHPEKHFVCLCCDDFFFISFEFK